MTPEVTDVRLKPIRNRTGGVGAEVRVTFTENGVRKHALTRVPYPISDTPYFKAQEGENFLRRRRARED